jgi:hypothetical protein
LVLAVAAGLTVGCAGRRIEDGVFHSPTGYRVQLPGPDWAVRRSGRADLELRHPAGGAAMMVNAVCGPIARRSPEVLERHLLLGLRERRILEHGTAAVGGLPASHLVVEAVAPPDPARVRIEAYVVIGPECVYDLVYAAAPDRFALHRPAYRRLVGSFAAE